MNNILQLKGEFEQKNNEGFPGLPNLPKNKYISIDHIEKLIRELKLVLQKWENDDLIGGALVSVHYIQVVAKSNRIKDIFAVNSKIKSNDSIRGSKFETIDGKMRHIFTHFIPLDILREAIKKLENCCSIIVNNYGNNLSHNKINEIQADKKQFNQQTMRLHSFLQLLVDCYYVDSFSVDEDSEELKENSIITIYKTNNKAIDIFKKIGINISEAKIIDETTINLFPDELKVLKNKAPYLIAMQTTDVSKIKYEDIIDKNDDPRIKTIPDPTNEPIIGVIDTLFYEDVYFSKWVDYRPMIDKAILETADINDYKHGTSVSSIIVDGPSINPDLDDGCGRFRVRHFGVALNRPFSSFTILKQIRTIVASNTDIKVWNLSLGSALEVHRNFISPEAAELDRIQCEYNVIFIVAGTNDSRKEPKNDTMRIGAPADSLNSIVVNSVKKDKTPSTYYRRGPVLSFFHKPDLSYYGGDSGEPITVCTPTGEGKVCGTSFAAPWIARKMAFLMYNMDFSREIAKALLVDASAGWDRQDNMSHSIGYGVVPIKIDDILKSPNDEIKFLLSGVSEKYETYTYKIPVPISNSKQPFYAKATLCYFPRCSRNQGVDYTDTEMDIHFGRIIERNNRIIIDDINDNLQDENGSIGIYEGPARMLYRKWDNIKHISEKPKKRKTAKKIYGVGNWGLSIKSKERLSSVKDKEMPFGVVITIKEMFGQNRIEEFIKLCSVRGWIVNRVDVNNRLDIYNKAEEEVSFD